jgi:hypothetical protein
VDFIVHYYYNRLGLRLVHREGNDWEMMVIGLVRFMPAVGLPT